MRWMHWVVLLAVGFVIAARPVMAADEKGPARTETRLKRIALFKNGLGFFVREGTLSTSQGTVLVGPFAAPAHGTFWVSCPRTTGLTSVVAREIKVKGDPIPAREVAELLRANIGKKVAVADTDVVGTIVGFAPDRQASPTPRGDYGIGGGGQIEGVAPWGRGEYVLIKTDKGIVALSPYSISRVTFLSDKIESEWRPEVSAAELRAELASPKEGDWLSVSYLAKGITWAPSYLIDISDAKQARLSAKAEVVNEAEDLKGTHVDLITGFPNLKFADVLDPMARKMDLASFLQALGGAGARPAAGVMTQSVIFNRAMEGGGFAGADEPWSIEYGAAAAGRTAEDLFLYPVENVTLAKGETGYYPLFTQTVPYREFYQWEIPDYIDRSDSYRQPSPEAPQPETVWHSIRLTNATGMPLTTAPAEIVKDGQLLGQDVLNYTAASEKASTVVKITQAVSVKAEQTETESSRERDAVTLYGAHFDRVTLQGTLRVANYQDKAISLEVKKTLSGDVKSSSPKATDVTLARGLQSMNPTHELTWTIALEPNGSEEVKYTYQALIRR